MFKFCRTLGGYPTKPFGMYPIATGTAINIGAVVKLSAGKVVLADANDTGAILGIAAEAHSGSADPFNARANGLEIAVYDDPNSVFEVEMSANGTTYDTFTPGAVITGLFKATTIDGLAKDYTTSSNNKTLPFVVVGADTDKHIVYVKPAKHQLAAANA